jgi:hypothetical protein
MVVDTGHVAGFFLHAVFVNLPIYLTGLRYEKRLSFTFYLLQHQTGIEDVLRPKTLRPL